jgi:Tol biopolymer transport system component
MQKQSQHFDFALTHRKIAAPILPHQGGFIMNVYSNRIGAWLMVAITLLLGAWRVVTTEAQQNAAPTAKSLYQQALHEEEATGNLKAAIALYERVLSAKPDRALSAQTLIHMADCYQKLGDAQARKIYEQVLRDYLDQPQAAAMARGRLGGTEKVWPQNQASIRRLWTLPGQIAGTVSHDGRYLPWVDWSREKGKGDLFLHDLISGTDRRLTNDVKTYGNEFANASTFSRDDKQLAYSWFIGNRYELRLMTLSSSAGIPASRLLFSNEEISAIRPLDWSTDGRWVAVHVQRKDKTSEIGLIDVQKTSLRVLKTVDWRGPGKMLFAPDGKTLAYDLPAGPIADQRDVFVIAIDGSRETPAVVHPANDVLMAWSPKGTHLLFESDRSGSTKLWSVAVADQAVRGMPELIKADVVGESLGMTEAGSLYSLVKYPNFGDVRIADFDFTNGRFSSQPVPGVEAFVARNNYPSWSPDGKSIAFLSKRDQGINVTIVSRDTGKLREFASELKIYPPTLPPRWSMDGRFIAVSATDSKGRQGIFRIDVNTGEVTPIVASIQGNFRNPMWSPDGKKLYYWGPLRSVIERDLASGNEKVVFQMNANSFNVDLSPDGKYFAVIDINSNWSLSVVSSAGGQLKQLMGGESKGKYPADLLMWAPDSRAVFVYSNNVATELPDDRQAWRVPVDGSGPQKLDLNFNWLSRLISVNPSGNQIAFGVTEPPKLDEVWIWENFLPLKPSK